MTMASGQPSIIEDGFIAVKDGEIFKIGPMPGNQSTLDAQRIIDGSRSLVMPGLINAHNHAPMSLFRGLADDLPLMIWLQDHIFPAEARHVTSEMAYWCAKLAAAEMILSGTTTVADGYFFEEKVAEAFQEAGLRAIVAQGVIDFPAPGVPDPAKNIAHAEAFIADLQGKNPLITPAIFCHSPYTCSAATLVSAKKMARQQNVPFFIHVAETLFETNQALEKFGKTPVAYLNDLDILDKDTFCVHCVHLAPEDLNILKETNARVITCPESNMKLASGIAPVPEMIEKRIPVLLGTDGCSSNNNLDMFQEMDSCAKLHKVNCQDPTVLPARSILEMATCLAAEAFGLGDTIGSLEQGKRADMIIIDLDQPHLTPFYNADNLVYAASGSDVTMVIIDGQIIMQDRKILSFDVQDAISKVNNLSKALG